LCREKEEGGEKGIFSARAACAEQVPGTSGSGFGEGAKGDRNCMMENEGLPDGGGETKKETKLCMTEDERLLDG
jgi:hypothetical protein